MHGDSFICQIFLLVGCFVFCSEQSFLLGGQSPSCEPFYGRPSFCTSCPGVELALQSTPWWSDQIHSCTHPKLCFYVFFSSGTAHPLPQSLSRGLHPPFLISTQHSPTVNKENVKFLVGSLLADRVQPSRHASLLQTPKDNLFLEENMMQCSDIAVKTALLTETNLFQSTGHARPETYWFLNRERALGRWALTISGAQQLGFWSSN